MKKEYYIENISWTKAKFQAQDIVARLMSEWYHTPYDKRVSGPRFRDILNKHFEEIRQEIGLEDRNERVHF